MSAGWVGSTTRGQALLRRCLGLEGAALVAQSPSWTDARYSLRSTIYGRRLPPDADRAEARHAAAEATAWQLRVMAGWIPPASQNIARLFAAPLEIANIENHLAHLESGTPARTIHLGSLASAGPRVAAATSAEQVRQILSRSTWGDPGGVDPATVALGLRASLAARLARQIPDLADWSRGAVAVGVAREAFVFERPIAPLTGRQISRLLGTHWRNAASLTALADRLPPGASWPFDALTEPEDLWKAEVSVGQRIGSDAERLVRRSAPTKQTAAAVMTLLLVDLWLTDAAIEMAGRHVLPEFFDLGETGGRRVLA